MHGCTGDGRCLHQSGNGGWMRDGNDCIHNCEPVKCPNFKACGASDPLCYNYIVYNYTICNYIMKFYRPFFILYGLFSECQTFSSTLIPSTTFSSHCEIINNSVCNIDDTFHFDPKSVVDVMKPIMVCAMNQIVNHN